MHNNSMKSGRKTITLFPFMRVLLSINGKKVLLLYNITRIYMYIVNCIGYTVLVINFKQ